MFDEIKAYKTKGVSFLDYPVYFAPQAHSEANVSVICRNL